MSTTPQSRTAKTSEPGDDHEKLLKLATSAAVTVAALLIITKLVAYTFTQSVAVLASLVDSLMDVGASFLNLLAVRYALTPPDEEHRFGHGKAEALAGMAQAMFIAGSGVFLIVQAIERLVNPRPLEQVGLGLGVMLFSIAATVLLVMLQSYVVKRTHSTAIKADSLHYKSDILSNGAIVLALVLADMGWFGIDPLFALGIAGWVIYCAWQIAADSFQDLLDRELPDEERQKIIDVATAHSMVHGIHDLRTRMSGRMRFVQLHIELDDKLPLLESHRIADEVEAAILELMPSADVVIHQDPVGIMDARQGDLST